MEIGKEKINWPSFTDNVFVKVENPKEFTKKKIKPSKWILRGNRIQGQYTKSRCNFMRKQWTIGNKI